MPLEGLLLDMDGVLFHGTKPLPHAISFLRGISPSRYLLVTNNPSRTPEEVAERMRRMGFEGVSPGRILTSAQATAEWLAQRKREFRYFAVGAAGLHEALSAKGVPDRQRADYVVVGEGTGLDYEALTTGINLILKHGATLVATNPDETVDAMRNGEHVILPGCGALVAPFAVAAGVEPVVIGKPQPLLYEMALERLGFEASHCLMVGDRPDTDIAGAARLGMMTALVRTGRFAVGDPWPQGMPRPTWDVTDLVALKTLLEKRFPDVFSMAC